MESDDTIDLLAYLGRLKRFLLPAAVVGLVVAVGLVLLGMRNTVQPTYHMKAHVLVMPAAATDPSQADLQTQLQSQTMRTFVALEDLPVLTEAASKEVDGKFSPEEIADMTTIYWGGGSMLLAIKAESTNEDDAKAVSNAMAKAVVDRGIGILGMNPKLAPRLSLVEPAKPDEAFDTPAASRTKGLATGVGAGVGAGLVTAMALELVSSRRRRLAVEA